MLETGTPAQQVRPRAFLRVAGAPIVLHQLGIARELGCQRLVCLARAMAPELIALQHGAEAAGMKFNILPNSTGLAALVSATDELLVLTDGLLAEPTKVASALEGRSCVLVQPAEGAVEAGFERIDSNFASAGVVLLAGRHVEALHDLPADFDVASSLTRIALQSGVRRQELPVGYRSDLGWTIIASEAEAHAIEDRWLRQSLGETRLNSPGHHLARFAALMLGSTLLHSGNGLRATAAAVMIVLAMALAAAWAGLGPVGFGLVGVGWVLASLYGLLAKVRQKITGAPHNFVGRSNAFEWLCDVALVVLVIWQAPHAVPDSLFGRAFAPLILLTILRIVPQGLPSIWEGWVKDRSILGVALAIAAASGVITTAVEGLALMLGIWGLASLQQAGLKD